MNLTGKTFNRLTVIKRAENRGKQTIWLCECSCGKTAEISQRGIISGSTKSCGCWYEECKTNRPWVTKHGLSRTAFYKIFTDIKKRCNDKNVASYKYAGERGIICLWETFEDFRDDMYESYLEHRKIYSSRDTTIERIDNNGNYCKENCRWATQYEQSRNKRNLRMITFKGKTQCAVDWEKELGLYRNAIYNRLNVYGWTKEKALSTPSKVYKWESQ